MGSTKQWDEWLDGDDGEVTPAAGRSLDEQAELLREVEGYAALAADPEYQAEATKRKLARDKMPRRPEE